MNKKRVILITCLIMIIISLLFIIIINFKNKPNENNIENSILKEENNNADSDNLIDNNMEQENMKIYLKINNKTLEAYLENNSSSDALVEKLKQNDITLNMKDYANFEKVGELGFSLPRNDKLITTEPGDIILYQGTSLTIYYDTNRWNFTKLGKIYNVTPEELKEILGSGDVDVTITLNK